MLIYFIYMQYRLLQVSVIYHFIDLLLAFQIIFFHVKFSLKSENLLVFLSLENLSYLIILCKNFHQFTTICYCYSTIVCDELLDFCCNILKFLLSLLFCRVLLFSVKSFVILKIFCSYLELIKFSCFLIIYCLS